MPRANIGIRGAETVPLSVRRRPTRVPELVHDDIAGSCNSPAWSENSPRQSASSRRRNTGAAILMPRSWAVGPRATVEKRQGHQPPYRSFCGRAAGWYRCPEPRSVSRRGLPATAALTGGPHDWPRGMTSAPPASTSNGFRSWPAAISNPWLLPCRGPLQRNRRQQCPSLASATRGSTQTWRVRTAHWYTALAWERRTGWREAASPLRFTWRPALLARHRPPR